MKKYLFLLFLFIIYIFLIISDDSKPVIYYDNANDYGVSTVDLTFEDGISSNNIEKLFNKYKDEYFIMYIKLKNDNEYKLSCNNINKCIKDIYDEENNYFNTTYISNGISITKMTLLAYNDKITDFLNENDIYYKIK